MTAGAATRSIPRETTVKASTRPRSDVTLRSPGGVLVIAGAAVFGMAAMAGIVCLGARQNAAQFLATYIAPLCAEILAPPPQEAPFLADNQAAMSKMMLRMNIRPTGNVDRDFADMMVPHHQGAIDMAVAVLRYGRNPQIQRLAQEIIVTQQQEIAALRLAVGEPMPPPHAAPTNLPSYRWENQK